MKIILSTTASFGKYLPQIIQRLVNEGFRFVNNPFSRKITVEELQILLDEHKPIGLLAGTETITRSILEDAREYLKVISRIGTGCDNVDMKAAQDLGIQVFRTPGVLDQAVAELTLGMILSALRSIPCQHNQVCDGLWQKRMGRLLQDKVVGVIGFGAIGQRVGELLNAFGAKVIYYDPIAKDVSWATLVSLQDLLRRSDIITLHASCSEQILGEKELSSLCKSGITLINTARGCLVDEKALCKALASGQVSFACLDVFEQEPYYGELTGFDNVILTPHIGSYAQEARITMEKAAVNNLIAGLKTLGVII